MGQTLGAKGRSRRRTKRPAQNRLRVVVTYLLLISIVFSNISNPLFNVFAGQKTEKEEFRIYADELQRAAEEAFDDDEPLEEALEIDSKDKTLLKNYQKLFEADGRLYEIFPEYETVNEIDGITLRTFIRIAEDADPKSYMLTGEEELIFLYVNDGDASVSCRVNIDGYISAYCTVKPYESVFGENEETIVSGSGVTAGTGSGSGSGSGSGQTAEEAPVKDETAAAEDTKETEAPADTADEENSQKEENGAADKADEAPAEDDKTDETGDKDDAEAPADDSRDEESENNGDEADASENTGDSDTAEEADEADSNDGSDDTAEEAGDSDNGGDEADEGGSSDSGDTADDAGSSDGDSSVEIGMSINVRHLLATSIQSEEEEEAEETEEEEPEETEAETEESTEAETEESTEAAEAEAEEGSADAETKETTAGTVPETAVMADTPYAVKIVDEEEEDAFERVGSLDGKTYNIVALEQYKTARAFVIDFSESGLDKETLESTGHIITYTVDPTGSAELVHTAKLVRDGAEVAFGIVPQEGYKIAEVTSNGDELAIIDIADVERTATASEATRSEAVEDATRSEALREDAIYYEIPEVLEDQEVMILLEEIVPGSHPAFHQEKEINGVTITVSAEEGILPKGTYAEIKEVTENVEDAVKEKIEQGADEIRLVEATSVLAYDITLYGSDGSKLDDSWSKNGYVDVSFSGIIIEEKSEEVDCIEIMHIDSVVDLAKDTIKTEDIESLNAVRMDADSVTHGQRVTEVEFKAEHFSTYAIAFGNSGTIDVEVRDINGKAIGIDGNVPLTRDEIKNNASISVATIADRILSADSELSGKYIFSKAVAVKTSDKSESDITYMRYNTGFWGWGAGVQIQIKDNGSWEYASDYTVIFYFSELVPQEANVTVYGEGSVELVVNGSSKGTATKDTPLEKATVYDGVSYTLKFTPGTGMAVGALYINNQSIPLSQISAGSEFLMAKSSGKQDIKVYFSEIVTPDLVWKRSDTREQDGTGIKVINNKNLNFTWSDISGLNLISPAWDNGAWGTYSGESPEVFATWTRYSKGDNNYEVRRFQTTFEIPEGCSTSDYVRLRSIRANDYTAYNDGNIIPINDDIFIFVYKADEVITNDNYLNYLAFWTGTSNQSGLVEYHGIQGTAASQVSNSPFQYTDGWYCEADMDNIGSNMFKNYPAATEGDTFVLDVFVGEYAVGGGMDPLEIEFVKSSGYAATINYYIDEITNPEDEEHFLDTEGLKGLNLGEQIDLNTYADGEYLNKYQPVNYEDGIQSPVPYIVMENNGVINVLYTKKTRMLKVEYYTRDTLSTPAEEWTYLGDLDNQRFAVGMTYEEAVNKLYGKNTWISENQKDLYDDGVVIDGQTVIKEDTPTGTIIKVVYTKKTFELQVQKVLDNATAADDISNVKFSLYQADDSWKQVGSPLYTDITPDSENENIALFSSLTYDPNNNKYLLVETDTAPGYIISNPIKITVGLSATNEVIYTVDGVEGTYSASSPYVLVNYSGSRLPDTGGLGVDGFRSIGWTLIMTSVVFGGFNMKQAIRRRRKEE